MIELAQARDLLKRAVETQGRDFVYAPIMDAPSTRCSYLPIPKRDPSDDRPCTKTGCLIGVALELAGEFRQHNYPHVVITSLNLMYMPGLLSFEAEHYFAIAQDACDQQHASWGAAYDMAEAWAVNHLPVTS